MMTSNRNLILWLVSTLLAAVSAASAEQSWEPLTSEKAGLVFAAPGLAGVQPVVEQLKIAFHHTAERGYIKGDEEWPRALVVLEQLRGWRGFASENLDSLSEDIEGAFPEARLAGTVELSLKNHYGDLVARRFNLSGSVRCVYFRQFPASDPGIELIGSGRLNLGRIALYGWYCSRMAHPLTDGTISRFVGSIGVRDLGTSE